MNWLLEVCVVLLFVSINRTKVFGFNIEPKEPIVKRVTDKGSYFGFSVAQHWVEESSDSLNKNWILVGAPLGQNLQPNTNRSGALFKCPISNDPYDCIQVETDGRRFDTFDYDDTSFREPEPLHPPGLDEIKSGQWLGVTVKSQKPGGKVIVCAHRYVQSQNLTIHHYGWGLCYLLNNNLQAEEELQPCKGRPVDKLHQQYGFCQVGTSLALLNDGFALMGSPGPYTWRGTVFAKQVVGAFLDKDKTTYRGPLNDNPEPIDKYSYLGMSVTGGHFYNKNALSYASGAPRSGFHGEVFFFDRKPKAEELIINFTIEGVQFGSSFGYEILAADINNDGYDDLLVAAPFFYGNNKGGAVYIYTNLRECVSDPETCKPTSVLYGKLESRFGFSMTSLNDINKDGYIDVAIGAPYEGGFGAIYIYLGSKDGLNREPSQVLRVPNLRTFGYSLSGGLDMDLNGYPDLLVGAYDSDMAILYKTRPIIDITINIKGEERNNINATKKGCARDPTNQDNTCFSFQSCFVLSKFKPSGSFKVRYEVQEIPKRIIRIWFDNTKHPDKRDFKKTEFIEVNNVNREYCQDEIVYIKEGIGDILSPIQFKVNYTLVNTEVNSPILNKTSVKEFQASFQKSCGDDDVCESNLILNAGTLLEESDDGYILDLVKNEEFLLDANVTNLGESAYEAKVFVIHPEALSYIALQNKTNNVICVYHNNTLVICNLGNPFQENSAVNLRLRFEIKDTAEQKVDLKVFVNSTSSELSKQTSTSFVVVLQKVAEYTIEGKAITPNVFYAGEVKGESAMRYLEDIGSRVYHTYQVINHGQWHIKDMQVQILWPYQVHSERPEGGKWLLYLEDSPQIDLEPINFCVVSPRNSINPLGLNSSGFEPENYTNPISFTASPEKMRRKRDAEPIVAPQAKTSRDGKQRSVVTMDCLLKTASCVEIICMIKQLNKNDQVKIQIKSRVWNSTLVEDYSKVDWISIRSFAKILITDQTIVKSNDSVPSTGIETVAYPGIVAADTSLNIWIIVGSILLGLLVLIILILILYKVGFFKRNRVKDHTLSGNLKKQGEAESLMNEEK